MHAVEGGLEGGAAVAGVALLAGAGQDGEDALGIDLEDAFALKFDKVEVARLVEVDAERLDEFRLCRGGVVFFGPAAGDADERVGTYRMKLKYKKGRRDQKTLEHAASKNKYKERSTKSEVRSNSSFHFSSFALRSSYFVLDYAAAEAAPRIASANAPRVAVFAERNDLVAAEREHVRPVAGKRLAGFAGLAAFEAEDDDGVPLGKELLGAEFLDVEIGAEFLKELADAGGAFAIAEERQPGRAVNRPGHLGSHGVQDERHVAAAKGGVHFLHFLQRVERAHANLLWFENKIQTGWKNNGFGRSNARSI